MTIYPDASFLISWLYRPHALNNKARNWFARHQADDFLISEWADSVANTDRARY